MGMSPTTQTQNSGWWLALASVIPFVIPAAVIALLQVI